MLFFRMALIALLSFTSSGIFSSCFDLKVDTGYRCDRLHDRLALVTEGSGPRGVSQDERATSYMLGAKAFWQIYSTAYLRAEGHYGWVCSSTYKEGTIEGDISGNPWDASIGVGYGFFLHTCWRVAPVVGWSYDRLDFTATHLTTANFTLGTFVRIADIETRSTFQGPWVGLDLLFELSCFDLTLTYEAHRGRWVENRILQSFLGADFGLSTGFSQRRTQEPVWGHLFQVEGNYYFCNCWSVGCNLKYQVWQGQNVGSFRTLNPPVSPAFFDEHVTDLEWNSFALSFQLGRQF